MQIDIYTKPNCEYCQKAKTLLDRYNVRYNTILIGEDVTRETVLKLYPNMRVAPIIVIDGQLLGTYAQLLQWLATTDLSKEL